MDWGGAVLDDSTHTRTSIQWELNGCWWEDEVIYYNPDLPLNELTVSVHRYTESQPPMPHVGRLIVDFIFSDDTTYHTTTNNTSYGEFIGIPTDKIIQGETTIKIRYIGAYDGVYNWGSCSRTTIINLQPQEETEEEEP